MRLLLHTFLVVMALAWLVPIGTAIYNSFRYYVSDTQPNGPFSLPDTLTLDNYRDAWNVGEMGKTFGNTAFIVIPALFLTLLLAAIVASRVHSLQLEVQHRLPGAVHGRQPDAAAGVVPAVVPVLQVHALAGFSVPTPIRAISWAPKSR